MPIFWILPIFLPMLFQGGLGLAVPRGTARPLLYLTQRTAKESSDMKLAAPFIVLAGTLWIGLAGCCCHDQACGCRPFGGLFCGCKQGDGCGQCQTGCCNAGCCKPGCCCCGCAGKNVAPAEGPQGAPPAPSVNLSLITRSTARDYFINNPPTLGP